MNPHEKFFDGYMFVYFQLKPPDEQKGVRELHEDFNKQTYNRQTTSHEDSFYMSISEHSNSLASTIKFKCNKKKKDNASATIIFHFIFLKKPNSILVIPATLHSYGTQLTFNGSLGCN